jgi:hypothetical protein
VSEPCEKGIHGAYVGQTAVPSEQSRPTDGITHIRPNGTFRVELKKWQYLTFHFTIVLQISIFVLNGKNQVRLCFCCRSNKNRPHRAII